MSDDTTFPTDEQPEHTGSPAAEPETPAEEELGDALRSIRSTGENLNG